MADRMIFVARRERRPRNTGEAEVHLSNLNPTLPHMPLSHLLDTSVYCQPLKPNPLPSVEHRWRILGDDTLATSVICEAELLYGLRLRPSPKLEDLHERLLQNRLPVLGVDTVVAVAFSEIKVACRRKGFAASDFDFLIAATAKVHGLILATLNFRHFRGIEGLAIEDWSRD
jgi:predicted nucleic acid-binding protein